MDAIQFQAEVGEDGVIRVPDNVKLPVGPLAVTVTPLTAEKQQRSQGNDLVRPEDYATVGEWLYAVGKQAETWDTDLPSDLAENHDFYAHGGPKR